VDGEARLEQLPDDPLARNAGLERTARTGRPESSGELVPGLTAAEGAGFEKLRDDLLARNADTERTRLEELRDELLAQNVLARNADMERTRFEVLGLFTRHGRLERTTTMRGLDRNGELVVRLTAAEDAMVLTSVGPAVRERARLFDRGGPERPVEGWLVVPPAHAAGRPVLTGAAPA
jgi:hypothetical protein